MCATRYIVLEKLRKASTQPTRGAIKIDAITRVETIEFEEITKQLESYEQQLAKGHELRTEQLKQLRELRLKLVGDNSVDSEQLYDRISQLRDWNSRLKNIHFVNHLEGEYEAIDREFRLPQTTSKRRAELLEEQREISETLRMLQR